MKQDEFEDLGEGRSAVRDPETGKFLKVELTSEAASKMRRKANKKSSVAYAEEVDVLLSEAGYDNPDDAPLAFQKVCQQISEGGSRTIQAVIEYRRGWSPNIADESSKSCPVCEARDRVFGAHWSNESLEWLERLMRLHEIDDEDSKANLLRPGISQIEVTPESSA